MNYRKSLLAASIIAGLCMSGAISAQDATSQSTDAATTAAQQEKAKADEVKNLSTITVTGIRASEASSLKLKQYSDSHIEVVTSEDIGKLPAKNVADTLQRLPGVNISSASASEGGFDENDRVSLRGTAPSLTQTLINGHTVGTGDWFVLSQVQTVGRSVSYSMLPSEVVSQVVVHKSSEAKIQEGGAAGSVNIVTRRPLEFAKPITGEVSVGGVYSDLPGNTKPQFSGLFNFKNDANTFGVLVQGFYEKRALQRNGQEVVGGYNQFDSASPLVAAHPDLAGVYYPEQVGSVFFTQTRERKGGLIDVQFKPTDNLTLGLNAFYSKLKADNYNRNFMSWVAPHAAVDGDLLPGYTIKNGLLTSAQFAAKPGETGHYGVYDQISRPGASSKSSYVTLDGKWNVTDMLTFSAQVGTTSGKGSSPTQDVLELGTAAGGGLGWTMRGTGRPINWNLGDNNFSPSNSIPSAGWIFGGQGINVKDKEDWGQIDGSLAFDSGALASLDFGVRFANHTRGNPFEIAQGPAGDWQNLANYPAAHASYPGDVGSSLGGTFPTNIWYYTPAQLAAFNALYTNRDPVARFYWNDVYKVNEKDSAAYLQANFSGDRWSGNVGARWVRTNQNINYTSAGFDSNATSSSGPISGSAFGDYYWNNYQNTQTKLLPSANLRFELTDTVVARFAASQTMTRPDYSALAGTASLDDLTHTGSGGNPQLKPLISTNFDTSLEWYFAPRGLLSVGAYMMDLSGYVNFDNVTRTYKDVQASTLAGHDIFVPYDVSIPNNVGGNIKGVELNYIQPIGENFGVSANYTYANGHAANDKPLQGASKNTANVSAYFENAKFNARVSYTYRSEFFAGVSRTDNYFQSGIGNLAASLGYSVNDWMSVSFDAMNLNNPTLKYYVKTDALGNQPHAFYTNGRQYYVNLRFKF